jgi:hypothetical protein
MTLIIDFDYTIFDTDRFRKTFFHKWLVSLIIRNKRYPLAQFIYDDAREFFCNHKDEDIVLITAGPRWYQRLKVISAGVNPCVRRAYYSRLTPKGEIIQSIIDDLPKPIIYIDDNPHHLQSTKELCPNVKLIRMRRPNGWTSNEDGDPDIPEITSFEEYQTNLLHE